MVQTEEVELGPTGPDEEVEVEPAGMALAQFGRELAAVVVGLFVHRASLYVLFLLFHFLFLLPTHRAAAVAAAAGKREVGSGRV